MGRLEAPVVGVEASCAAHIDFDVALAILAKEAKPLDVETVMLADASGRVLACPVVAQLDAPRRDCAAMDGYAVREADVETGCDRFAIVGSTYAGDAPRAPLGPGEAVRIMTGAPMPAGSDRVIMSEMCQAVCREILIDRPVAAKPHVRLRASDFAAGAVVLPKGRLIDPLALVAAAAADVDRVQVWRRPRVHVVTSGDELVAPGTACSRVDTIPDSLSTAIVAFATQWRAEPVGASRIGDDRGAIERCCRPLIDACDVLVIVGGAARGDRDFAKAALDPLGLEIGFADVAIKPGKPVWYGRIGGTHILGLPGNPTAAMTVARLFLAPLLAGLAGRGVGAAFHWEMHRAATPLAAGGSREAFLCAADDERGVAVIERQHASAQFMLAHTPCWCAVRETPMRSRSVIRSRRSGSRTTMPRLLGAIIAGGASRRFGSDKAQALIDGLPLFDHVITALAPQVDAVVVCGRRWRGVRSIEDRPYLGLGPLGGLYAALRDAEMHGFDRVISAPVDTIPFPSDLSGLVINSGASVFRTQHLIGGWPASLADRLRRHLEIGHRSIRSWLVESGASIVDDDYFGMTNINQPHDIPQCSCSISYPD